MRRFTPSEDSYIIASVKRRTSIKRISLELEREKSSIAERIKVLRHKGLLPPKNYNIMSGLEIKIRMSLSLHAKLSSLAAARGQGLSKLMRTILEQWAGL